MLKKIQVEILSESINCPVLKLENRKFPGVLIQGDTLKNITVSAETILESCKTSDHEETIESCSDLLDQLKSLLFVYERTLKDHGMQLPYT